VFEAASTSTSTTTTPPLFIVPPKPSATNTERIIYFYTHSLYTNGVSVTVFKNFCDSYFLPPDMFVSLSLNAVVDVGPVNQCLSYAQSAAIQLYSTTMSVLEFRLRYDLSFCFQNQASAPQPNGMQWCFVQSCNNYDPTVNVYAGLMTPTICYNWCLTNNNCPDLYKTIRAPALGDLLYEYNTCQGYTWMFVIPIYKNSYALQYTSCPIYYSTMCQPACNHCLTFTDLPLNVIQAATATCDIDCVHFSISTVCTYF
jgi:hypothetical protein